MRNHLFNKKWEKTVYTNVKRETMEAGLIFYINRGRWSSLCNFKRKSLLKIKNFIKSPLALISNLSPNH